MRVDLFLADPDLRRLAGRDVPAYLPDAIARLLVREGAVEREHGLIVEVDLGHESPRYVATRKLRLLVGLWSRGEPCWGLPAWRPVLFAPGLRRLRVLARAIVAEGGGDLVLLGDLRAVSAESIFARTLATAREMRDAPPCPSFTWTRTLLDPAPAYTDEVHLR